MATAIECDVVRNEINHVLRQLSTYPNVNTNPFPRHDNWTDAVGLDKDKSKRPNDHITLTVLKERLAMFQTLRNENA